MIIGSIRHEINRLRRKRYPKKPLLTIIINENARRELMKERSKYCIVNSDSTPRTIDGIPYTVDKRQNRPFRIVER